MSEARSYVDLMARLGGLQGYLELERLREMMEDLKAIKQGPRLAFDQSVIPPESRLKWGRGAKGE